MKASRIPNPFCVAAIALILITACSKHQEHVAQPTPVTVWTVANTAGEHGLRYSANIKPDVQVDLSFKAGGYIDGIFQMTGADGRRRNVQEGDFIKKGTVLGRVKDTEYRDRVTEAQASLTKAKSDFDRAARLFENQSVSKADYDAAYAGYTAAQARYDQAAQALRDCALHAPMDGYVLKRNIEVGTLAAAGMPGFVLADTRVVKAVFGVPDMIAALKIAPRALATVIVVICSDSHFLPSFGVKDHGLHRNSSRICANTSCAGMPDTFPCRSSWYRFSASLIQASSMSENSSSPRLWRSRSARVARAFDGNDKAF